MSLTAQECPCIGIVVSVVARHWRRLPLYLADQLEFDDLVQSILLRLVRVQDRYDPKRGSPSTFVWWVAERECSACINKYRRRKEIMILDGLLWHDEIAVARRGVSLRESLSQVEALITDASPALRRALGRFIRSRRWRGWPPLLLAEMQVLVRKHQVSPGELGLVLRVT